MVAFFLGCFADWYIDSSELVKQGGKDTATEDHISTRVSFLSLCCSTFFWADK